MSNHSPKLSPSRRLGASLALVFAFGLGACETETDTQSPNPAPVAEGTPEAIAPPLPGIAPMASGAKSSYEQNSVEVFKATAPSVVFIRNKVKRANPWTMREVEAERGQGSGFVWDRRGHIVTNYHVVDGGTSYEVTFQDGTSVPAKLVGGERKKDIAILKVAPSSKLRPVTLLPKGAKLEVGSKAIAIGNPLGQDHSMTVGVISATGRSLVGFGNVTIRDMVQTDAAINPGNSGGPLLDSRGYVIGMNTMILSKSGTSSGIGFAVPADAIAKVVPDIINYGTVRRAGLGVDIVEDWRAREAGIRRGVVIAEVARRSGAYKAGLRGLTMGRRSARVGDIIIGIDNHRVDDYDDLYNALDRYKAGQTVGVKVLRDGKSRVVDVELMELE